MGILPGDDVRLAMRRLAKRPAATFASILALACGIGGASATWSLLDSVLLHPLPVHEPERLVVIGRRSVSASPDAPTNPSHVYPTYLALRDSGTFERLAAGGTWSLLVAEGGSVPQPRTVFFASHDYFTTLGVRLARGTGFRPEDDRRGAPLTAVLSDRYWRRALNADPNVLGQTIQVSKTRATIVGVAPRGFRGLNLAEAPDIYLPLHTIGEVGDATINYFAEPLGRAMSSPTAWIRIVGRLRTSGTPDDARARLNALDPDVRRGRVFTLTDVNADAIPEAVRPGMVQFTRLLAITVGLLLLIGSLTVGMLLLVRTEDRRDEFAVCLALGGSRMGLARGVAVEGTLLSIAGAAAAVPVAWWLFSGVRTFQLPGRIDIELLELSLGRGAWLAAAGAAVATTLLISFIAALVGFAGDTANALHARGGVTPVVTRRRTRTTLVAVQVAFTFVLVAGAGLFARSLMTALSLNPGIDTSHIVTGSIELRPYGYSPQRAATFFDDLRERLSHNAALKSVSMTVNEGGMGAGGKITIDGVPREMPSFLAHRAVDERYFSTIGLPILSGRDFSRYDTATSQLVVIVSESFGRLIAGGGSPIGHRVTESSWRRPNPPAVAEVIGVVPDVITNVNTIQPLVKYYSLAQRTPSSGRTIVLRAPAEPALSVRETMTAIRDLDSTVTVPAMQTVDEQIGRQMNPQRFGIYVLGALGSIALLLTVLGTYVLAESMAAMRRREMSIRAALGARGVQLGGLVLKETGWLVGIGLCAGLVMAWIGTGTIRTLLYRIEPLDPTTLASSATLILALALLVSLRPAAEAARVDFTRALKEE